MKYAISYIRTDELKYKDDRYDTFEEAEKAFNAIPEDERVDFGIAELLSDEEIKTQADKPEEV